MKHVERLDLLVKGLNSGPTPTSGRLYGKQLDIKGKGVWIAIDGEDRLHLLLSVQTNSRKNFLRLSKFKQRFLSFSVRKWMISSLPSREYLDVCCIADRKSEYRRPFIYFVSDCLDELVESYDGDAAAILRVAQRWHRFWLLPGQQEVTPEWIKGLLGELWFLLDLIKEHGNGALKAWTGPDGHDHDFQANGFAVEIKVTETMPAVLKISNLGQLDYTLFKGLWLVVYAVTAREEGIALPDVVAALENTIKDAEVRDFLGQRLAEAGYRRQLEGRYRENAYKRSKIFVYPVNKAFPALTRKHLKKPLDERIQAVRYSVKITGLSAASFDGKDFRRDLKSLCSK